MRGSRSMIIGVVVLVGLQGGSFIASVDISAVTVVRLLRDK
jgi:hypothetical protein